MSAVRRALWVMVLMVWPLVVIIKALWAPKWGGDLSDGGAAFTFVTGAVLLRPPRTVPRLAERRTKRQLAELARRMSAQETATAAQQAQMDGLAEGMLRAFAAVDKDAPGCVGADASTLPSGLRRVV